MGAASKDGKKARAQRRSLRGDLCTLQELPYGGPASLHYQRIADLWAFYVTRSPKVGSGSTDRKPTQQSIILGDSGWSAKDVERKIEELLFEDGIEFVKPDRDFLQEAHKKGFFAESRPTCSRLQGVVKISAYGWSGKDKREGKSPRASETQGACVLRHIRNSLAHGLVYKLPDGRVLLKDYERAKDGKASNAVSGYILTTLDGLIALMDALMGQC